MFDNGIASSNLKMLRVHCKLFDLVFFFRYLDFGGEEQEGISALAKSYVGFPNMVNVMIEWLHAAGYRKREIQNLVEEHLKTVILRNFDTTKADLIFTEEVKEMN